ncbi:2-isopropylmalate synthase [Enterobacteriaceae endosymbiont of Macroplea appendiculata]|uniref:2-isopropylmalate synthase n=1 Tax=Enterobacteriaceae endosymbiont of Macroplea appendiculata TaxID=2675790 RepID=UPI001448EB7A|nr:2-isopropylmalate synthase [Enterobacteriaceae endosymbiont of Macroplea appendiculata]QJC31031.1 2-isopropylmalate synthase [Enterobacteriaceae endosymbiont of Macroplea appendiculata]
MQEQIIIFDTTLRDGEQSLKCSLTTREKIEIALSLESMGIDIIEVGFPVSSPKDFHTTKEISSIIKNSTICGLARCKKNDIDLVYESLKKAKNFRIHIFLATSPLHITTKLKMTLDQVIERIIFMIKYAKQYTHDIEFSCEDSTRTPIKDLCLVIEAAIQAGATTINIPDTVGYILPYEYGDIITSIKNKVHNIDKCIISVHTHNDLGMAVGNAITAIHAGARQIEGTINGIGERAGNCALEEIIMAIYTRKSLLNVTTNINKKKIYNTTKIVSQICKIPIALHKAIIGKNAFSHSSGIHQDGIIKNRKTYEIIDPNIIGLQTQKIYLTAKSGRAAIKYHMELMGYPHNTYDINQLYNNFIKLAEKKGQVYNYDLVTLAFNNKIYNKKNFYTLVSFHITYNSTKISHAMIKLKCNDIIYMQTSTNIEPINAIFKAIKKIIQYNIHLLNYKLIMQHNNNVIGYVHIKIRYKNITFYGISHFTNNIIETFIHAIINCLNDIWKFQQTKNLYKHEK